jgi:hypothetical protein
MKVRQEGVRTYPIPFRLSLSNQSAGRRGVNAGGSEWELARR